MALSGVACSEAQSQLPSSPTASVVGDACACRKCSGDASASSECSQRVQSGPAPAASSGQSTGTSAVPASPYLSLLILFRLFQHPA